MNKARLITVLFFMWMLIAGLITRLVFVQLVHHDHYKQKAERRRRRIEFLPARRGRILDCKNRVLAVDQPRYELCAQLTELDPVLDLVARLARSLGQSRKSLIGRIALARKQSHRADSYALISGPVGPRRLDRMARLMRKQRRLFRHAHRLAELPKDQAVLRWIRGHGVAVSMAVLKVRRRTLTRLALMLGRDTEGLIRAVEQKVAAILAEPDVYKRLEQWSSAFVLDASLKFLLSLSIEERLFELPGIIIRKKFKRHYPFGASAAHLIGYVGAMSAQSYKQRALTGQIANLPFWYYKRYLTEEADESAVFPPDQLLLGVKMSMKRGSRLHDDVVGQVALERFNDSLLAGIPGARVVERDYKNHRLGILLEAPEQHGRDLKVTIDMDLQGVCEAALDEALKSHGARDAGAGLVVMNVEDGRVLALASGPRFNLNEVNHVYKSLLSDARKPLFNRSTSAMPPGSTYKILSALAFFDRRQPKALPLSGHFSCSGRLFQKYSRFKCDGVHGSTQIVRAIQCSCNVFFWKSAAAAGYDCTLIWARELGFGQRIGDGIPGESRGQIPDRNTKNKRYALALQSYKRWALRYKQERSQGALAGQLEKTNRRLIRAKDWAQRCALDRGFNAGDERNAVIGQGSVLATPIQIARLAAFIANGGWIVKPRIHADSPVSRRLQKIEPGLLADVRLGMRRVVTHGTASNKKIGLYNMDVAGKTGTAERNKGQPNYAWFMGYFPASRPEIAFAIVVDKTAGHGGGVAGPVARELVRAYARGRPSQ
jgi:penicillin-binding protein 2